MQQSNKIGYEEYERKLDKRIAVEKRRQDEYEKCKQMSAEIDSHMYTR
ncbi:hypothetical protein [Lentibacillus salicampi]|nr:hypothetical protein [Lentibacillus salicampi]